MASPGMADDPANRNSPNGAAPSLTPSFAGASPTLRRLMLLAEVTAPRLHLAALEGEAGTGKHLFAQNIHRLSQLAGLPFRRRDAREWLASEADPSEFSGTLYLDRVDLLAPVGQGLLLKLVKTLNADYTPPSFLLLVSSHASLRLLAGQSRFLPDLAFRLSAIRFSIPPLREHREDIALITQVLIDRICRHYRQPTTLLAPGTLPRLLQHHWPGNVRELASVVETAILDSTTGILRPTDLALPNSGSSEPQPPAPPSENSTPLPNSELPADLTLDAAIQRHLQLVLNQNRGNKLRAARQLGISRSTLYRLLVGEAKSPGANPLG
jgi:DNA-binding NtrC family response regulator